MMGIRNYSKELHLVADQSHKERDYWLNKLSGELVKICFPYDYRYQETKKNDRDRCRIRFSLTEELFARLMKVSNVSDVRLYVIMVTGLLLTLNKYTSQKDILIGAPTYKQDIDGELINTVLAFRNRLEDNMSCKELLLQVAQTVFEANENQNYPIEALLYHLNLPLNENDFPLFDVAILLENIHDPKYIQGIHLNMIFSFLRSEKLVEGVLEYNPLLFEEATVQRINRHFTHALQEVLFNIDKPVSEVEILTGEEKKQLIFGFNNNQWEFPSDKTICQLLEKNAENYPDRIAVTFENHQLTYRKLNERANRLARHLLDIGVRKDHPVGILLNRSLRMAEGILGVWKAGGAYIPMDTEYPLRRLIELFEDSGTNVLLTQLGFTHFNGGEIDHVQIIDLDHWQEEIGKEETADLDSTIMPGALAYVIYTSGSTGKPKGAMIEHIGMMNHIYAKINDLKLTEESIIAQNASHTFDISVWQFFAALAVRGKTVIYPREIILQPHRFLEQLMKNQVTILEIVPSYLSLILDAVGRESSTALPFEYLLVTGEEVKPHQVKQWFERYPHIKMVNAYGPTEASDDITHYIMDKAPAMERIPIGKPLQNLNIYIVNDNMKLCPVGVKGEICVSGVGVGRGYLNDEGKTKKVFMEDPFIEEQGVRFYKTGDFGLWLPDGNIEIFGRKDNQVKIRGFRIELSEIENKLLNHKSVKEAVVIDKEDEKENKYLCAYLVPHGQWKVRELKDYLSEYLPEYMVPSFFVALVQMPLTTNGKIDRKALPEPDQRTQSVIEFISEEKLRKLQELIPTKKDKPVFTPSPGEQERFFNTIKNNMEKERLILREYSAGTGRNYFSLSQPQRVIYYTEKRYPGTGCEINGGIVKYHGEIDKNILEKAINKLLYLNEGFRIRIVELEHESSIQAAQYISDYQEKCLDYFDFSGKENEITLEEWLAVNIHKPFDLIDNDLFYFAYLKFSEKESGYFVKLHHMISDGITFSFMLSDLDRFYEKLKAFETIDDEPNPSYVKYIFDEQEYLESPRARDDRIFWHEIMFPLPPEWTLFTKPGDSLSIKVNTIKFPFPKDLSINMREYCKNTNATLFKLVLSAVSLYIAKVNAINEFFIGSVSHGRAGKIYKKTAGVFINFLPIRICVDEELDFDTFVKKASTARLYTSLRHQKFPFNILADGIRESTGVDIRNLFEINIIDNPTLKVEKFQTERYLQADDPTPLSIHINPSKSDIYDSIELAWMYHIESFSESDIRQLHKSLAHLLNQGLGQPGKKLSEIELLSPDEKKQILYDFNDKDITYPEDLDLPGSSGKRFAYVLSEKGIVLPVGVLGELCVGNASSEEGENLTQIPVVKDSLIYRTGELVRWLPDGRLEFWGKKHHRVLINGRNINLGEIERYLLNHNDIEEVVVVAKEEPHGGRYLCAYIAAGKRLVESELREYLSRELPHHMIPPYFVQLEKVPSTSVDKPDRQLLEAIKINLDKDDYEAPRNEIEKRLVEIWEQVLGRRPIGINDNFFTIGGDSIRTIQIASRMNKAGYKVEMKDIFQNPTISELAPLLKKMDRITPQTEITGTVPLTPSQKRFFANPRRNRHHFNQAMLLYSKDGFDESTLEMVISKLHEHHDGLRMTFREENGEIVQSCHGLDYPVSIEVSDFRNPVDGNNPVEMLESKVNKIQSGINLEKGPLMKLGLFHLQDGDRLLIVIHHLVIDGVSWRILLEDINTLYRQYKDGEQLELPLKTDSFKYWSERLSEYVNSLSLSKEKTYWEKLESTEIAVIKKDFEEEENYVKDADVLSFSLNQEETSQLLTKVHNAFGTEINDILLTALGLGIKNTFGNERVLIGLESHGREEIINGVDIKRTVGWFTSAYPVLLDFSYESAENQLARQIIEVKETLRKVPNKGIGYGILRYLPPGKNARDIDFTLEPQIIFNYLGQFDLGGTGDAKPGDMPFRIAKESPGIPVSPEAKREIELEVSGIVTDNQLTMSIMYSKRQYKLETIARFLDNFKSCLGHIISFYSNKKERELTPSDLTYKDLSIEILDQLQKEYAVEDIYTLTPMQEGMLFHSLYDLSSAPYCIQSSYRLYGKWNISFLEKSLNELIKRYGILRTAFVYKGLDRPLQVVLKERPTDFLYEDLCEIIMTGVEKETYIEEFKEKDMKRLFDLEKDGLMRLAVFKVAPLEYQFTWSFHHIIMDGWCIGILISDFFEIYNGFFENRTPRLPKVIPYSRYIEWLVKQDKEGSKEYWAAYLEGYDELASAPRKKTFKTGEGKFEPRYMDFILEKEDTMKLNELAARKQVTLNTVIQAVWGIILGHYNRKKDVVFGAVVSGRPSEIDGVESIVGLFINTLPVRINFEKIRLFSELIRSIQEKAIASEPYHYYPLAKIQSESNLKQNLLDHILVFENFPIVQKNKKEISKDKNNHDNKGLTLEITDGETNVYTNYDFYITIVPGEQLGLRLKYNAVVYEKELIDKVGSRFWNGLKKVAYHKEIKIEELKSSAEEEKQNVVNQFNEDLEVA